MARHTQPHLVTQTVTQLFSSGVRPSQSLISILCLWCRSRQSKHYICSVSSSHSLSSVVSLRTVKSKYPICGVGISHSLSSMVSVSHARLTTVVTDWHWEQSDNCHHLLLTIHQRWRQTIDHRWHRRIPWYTYVLHSTFHIEMGGRCLSRSCPSASHQRRRHVRSRPTVHYLLVLPARNRYVLI